MSDLRDAVMQSIKPQIKTEVSHEKSSVPSADVTRDELLSALSLNTPEYLHPYDGNPPGYHVFIMSFNQTVDKIADPQHKLTQLLRLTKGEAHHAIEGCAIIGGEKGYDPAGKILDCRFGDKNKISCCIMNHLTHSSPIKTGHDLQKLADDLVTADLSFEAMGKSYDNQELISKIVLRLSRYHRDEWRKGALDHKESKGDYLALPRRYEMVKL